MDINLETIKGLIVQWAVCHPTVCPYFGRSMEGGVVRPNEKGDMLKGLSVSGQCKMLPKVDHCDESGHP